MIRAIAIDDSQPYLDTLTILLARHCADTVRLMGTFQSVKEAVEAIDKLCPELVFLDVRLHNQTAFDLLGQLGEIDFDIIFTTNHPEYAVQAIKLSAIGYLVKPIDAEELKAAVGKALDKRSVEERNRQLEKVFDKLKYPKGVSRFITVTTPSGLTVLSSSNITHCESNSNYTSVYAKSVKDNKPERKFVVAKTLDKFEELLSNYGFFRTHNSHLVNLAYVDKLDRDGTSIIMVDAKEIPLSTRRKGAFLKRLTEE